MLDSYGILAFATKYQEIIRRCNRTAAGVVHDGLMREAFSHSAIAHGQGFFPDVIARDVVEAERLMPSHDIAWEISQRIAPAITSRHVSAVDG